MAAVLVAGVLGGAFGWVLRGQFEGTDPAAVPLGLAEEFAPGSITDVALDIGFFDTLGVEAEEVEEFAHPARVEATRLYLVHIPEAGLMALLQRSPLRGCRLQEVTRQQAADFGHAVPNKFEGGFLDVCHGGLFSLNDTHLAGPGIRGMDRFPIAYRPDGTVLVDLTVLRPAPEGADAP